MIDVKRIAKLELEYGSSFYLFDVKKLKENYKKIENAFKSRYNKFLLGYSYKTNYLPYLCKEISKLGGYAEVVSRLEYDLALKIGANPKNIIYNGPGKTKEDIETALSNESILNVDSLQEIDIIEEFCRNNEDKIYKMGLRVNFDISNQNESPLQEGFLVSRFGICVENGDFQYAIHKLKNIDNIKITGLHGHFSTRNRGIQSYEIITKGLCNLAKEYISDTVEYIDIGGGIYGELPSSFNVNAPSFDDYANAICSIMNREFEYAHNQPFLVLEPGISLVANTFLFVAKVLDVKKIRDSTFVLVDGSVHNIKPTMHNRNLPMGHVKRRSALSEIGKYQIVGYTCMEKDYLAHEVSGEIPNREDYLVFENVGAYTIVFNPPFIKERPCIVAMDGEQTFIARKKETIKQFFNEDLYCF